MVVKKLIIACSLQLLWDKYYVIIARKYQEFLCYMSYPIQYAVYQYVHNTSVLRKLISG